MLWMSMISTSRRILTTATLTPVHPGTIVRVESLKPPACRPWQVQGGSACGSPATPARSRHLDTENQIERIAAACGTGDQVVSGCSVRTARARSTFMRTTATMGSPQGADWIMARTEGREPRDVARPGSTGDEAKIGPKPARATRRARRLAKRRSPASAGAACRRARARGVSRARAQANPFQPASRDGAVANRRSRRGARGRAQGPPDRPRRASPDAPPTRWPALRAHERPTTRPTSPRSAGGAAEGA